MAVILSAMCRELRLKCVRASRSSPQRLRVCLCYDAVALGGGRNNVDDLAAALRAELDSTGREGEQRVVAATADVDARVEVGSALADEDFARADDLGAEALHAAALRVGIATVTSGRCALFVCHFSAPNAFEVGGCYLMLVILTRVSSERWPMRRL